jgi:hypothetical protein
MGSLRSDREESLGQPVSADPYVEQLVMLSGSGVWLHRPDAAEREVPLWSVLNGVRIVTCDAQFVRKNRPLYHR